MAVGLDRRRAPAASGHRPVDAAVLAAIALGGVLGSEARYGLNELWPSTPGQWPWATWIENVSGAFLIGALMVLITELTAPHRLVRPFLGVGVLGGYTTFSTASLEVYQLLRDGRPGWALGYLAGSVVAALVAVTLGVVLARRVALARRRARRGGRR